MNRQINGLAELAFDEYRKFRAKILNHGMIKTAVEYLLIFVRDGLAYAYLIYMMSLGRVSAGEFVLYFSIIASFSGYISEFFSCFSRMRKGSLGITYFREFLDIKSKFNRDGGIPAPCSAPSIEPVNVSYTYPNAAEPTIKNVSFTINARENIALVGLNGADKTTLIKLICGMLTPTEGEILVDGRKITEYNRDEYYGSITALFQNFRALPLTIAQNIAVATDTCGEIDEKRLSEAVVYAGLGGYIEKLRCGLDTLLVKKVNDVKREGGVTEPSGGEMQKILLARAYYHDRSLLILDEPTSALDPIAESNMYEKYLEFSQNKTSVFISHRLASTLLCDRIIYIEDGAVAEVGSHGELMKLGGKYRELFDIQSSYYKEAANNG